MKNNILRSVAALLLLTALVFVAYLKRPGLGDDFTYWKVGFETSQGIPGGWRLDNFHDLRWPMWGAVWLFSKILGPGLLPYYAVPFFYLSIGAILTFFLARKWLASEPLAWIAATAFLFHPLLDPVAYRPMPDLSEGVWAALALVCWLAAMRAVGFGKILAWSGAAGLFIAVAHANRFTGILILPVLGALTLWYFPRQFPRFLMCLGGALLFIGIECAIYHSFTGDWLYSLHTNMGAKGKKGTDPVNPLTLPFRFLDTLWKGGLLAPLYMTLACAGIVGLWKKSDNTARVAVGWFLIGYLGYSCALQQIWPPRPMLRDADRFLCALAIPLTILLAGGIGTLGTWLTKLPQPGVAAWVNRVRARPAPWMLLFIVFLFVSSRRGWFDLDYLPEARAYISSRPAGTKVFTHRSMWDFAHLIHYPAASKLDFAAGRPPGTAPKTSFMDRADDTEKWAGLSDEVWFVRKLMWLRARQEVRDGDTTAQPPLASYVDRPEDTWRFAELIKVDKNPEIVFYQRRKADSPAPAKLTAEQLGLTLPWKWDGKKKEVKSGFTIPAELKGSRARIRIVSASKLAQPVQVTVEFSGLKEDETLTAKPTCYPEGGVDFFNIEIPPNATEAQLELRFDSKAKDFELKSLEVVADGP